MSDTVQTIFSIMLLLAGFVGYICGKIEGIKLAKKAALDVYHQLHGAE